jgi:hypothetical protein
MRKPELTAINPLLLIHRLHSSELGWFVPKNSTMGDADEVQQLTRAFSGKHLSPNTHASNLRSIDHPAELVIFVSPPSSLIILCDDDECE